MRSRRISGLSTGRRLPVLIPLLALAVACQATVEITTSTTETTASPATSTTIAATSTTRVSSPLDTPDEPAPDSGRVLRMGVEADAGAPGFCGDPDIYGMYLADTRPSLYEIAMPGVNVIPDLGALSQPPEPRSEGGLWVIDVPLREDAVWSDGHPITADDIVFTSQVAAEPWGSCLDWALKAGLERTGLDFDEAILTGSGQTGLRGVEAIDKRTVRLIFNGEPGLAVWPHAIGMAEIMAEHFWAPHVAEARRKGLEAVNAISDPAVAVWETQRREAEASGHEFVATIENIMPAEIDAYLDAISDKAVGAYLHALSADGEPSGGPLVFAEWDPSQSIRYVANPRYYRSGEVIDSGDATYRIGPFIDEQVIRVYRSGPEKVLGLVKGEIDQTFFNAGPALGTALENDSGIVRVRNESNIVWYLGFNLRKPPMSDLPFRQALAMMIDREFMANAVFQNLIPAAWTLLPQSNHQFFDSTAAERISSKYRDPDLFERLERAVAILEEAGYTWEEKPTVGKGERGEASIEPGSEIRMPNGEPAPELRILGFGAGFGDFYAFPAYNLYIERWLQQLGFPARSRISAGPSLNAEVWPGIGVEPDFDMYLLGWDLGNPGFPSFYETNFHSRNRAELNNGANAFGYVNSELDKLTEQLSQVKEQGEALQIIWQLETIIDKDLPCMVLMRPPFREIFRAGVQYPFTETLGGLGRDPEVRSLVRIEE